MPKKLFHKVFTLQVKVHTCNHSETDDLDIEEIQKKVMALLVAGSNMETSESQRFVINAFDVDPPSPPETLEEKVDRIERVINAMAKRERDLLKILADSVQERWR